MLARKSFLIFLTNVLGAALGVVALFFVGRFFDPGPYGMVWFAISLLGLLSALTKLGFDKAHVKRVSEGRDLAACMGTFITIRAVVIGAFVVVALAVVLVREFTVGWIAATSFSVMLVVILYTMLLKVRAIAKTTFNAMKLTASMQSIPLVENVARLPLVILVTLAFSFSHGRDLPLGGIWAWVTDRIGEIPPMTDETGALLYAGAYTAAVAVSLVWAVMLLRRHRIPVGRFDRGLAKSYWVFAWPVATYSILTGMTNHIDIVMLGYFWTGTEVGFYRAAFQFVTIVTIIPTAVRTLFFPMINELISKEQWSAVKDLAVTTQRMMSLVMIPILMLTLVYAEDVFRIVMSLTWIPSAPVLRLLVLHATLGVFSLVAMDTLLGKDRVKLVMAVSLTGVFLNIGLNFVFIPASILGVPLFGLKMTGAALASVVSKSVVVIIYFVLSKRTLDMVFISPTVLLQLLAAAAVGFTLWSVEHLVEGVQVLRWWDLAIASAAGVLLYVGVLFALRGLGRKDILFFIDLLNPGHMGRYIRDELKGTQDKRRRD